jgi:hypothetical protein
MSAPSVTVTIEPAISGTVLFLECAPPVAGGNESGQMNLVLKIKNMGVDGLRFNKIEISVASSSTAPMPFSVTLPKAGDPLLAANQQLNWVQPEDYLFAIPGSPSLTVKLYADGFSDPAVVTAPLGPHASPTPDGSYRFWAEVRDLRPGEFWQVHGFGHGQSNYAQLFAYDVGVGVESGSSHDNRLPGTDNTRNDNYRIWGKPIYAIADGTVTHFLNDFPTNPHPKLTDDFATEFPDIQLQIDALGHGNGNFFTITDTTGEETVLYAHLQTGSLNPNLMSIGAAVKKGDFLGLAGNSGASGNPHTHIHANKANSNAKSWVDFPRPLPFRHARAIAWTALTSDASSVPWVKLNGRGVPAADCAVWPSDIPVVDLKEVKVKHFAINADGQVWVVKTDGKVRTTSDRLPGTGIFFDVDPKGAAKEVAVRGQKPYLIGTDDKIWEGLPDKWQVLPGSPACSRLTVDGPSGKVWVVALDNRILSFDPATKAWVEHAGGGKAKDICVHNGIPYVLGMDDRVYKSKGVNGWGALAGEGKGKRIAVDAANGKLWVVGMNDGIWSYSGSGNWVEHPGGGKAKDLFVQPSMPYVIGLDDGLWKSAASAGWQKMNIVEPT